VPVEIILNFVQGWPPFSLSQKQVQDDDIGFRMTSDGPISGYVFYGVAVVRWLRRGENPGWLTSQQWGVGDYVSHSGNHLPSARTRVFARSLLVITRGMMDSLNH
jgi:hypothetical protein